MHLFLVGAGHVGLVTAVGMARLGHRVTVADIDAARIDGLRAGRAPLFEPGLEDAIRELGDRLAFTTATQPPDDVRHSFVAVGTPLGPEGHSRWTMSSRRSGGCSTGPGRITRSSCARPCPWPGPDALAALRGERSDAPSIVTNPEFMREGSALRDFEKPGRVVVGWLDGARSCRRRRRHRAVRGHRRPDPGRGCPLGGAGEAGLERVPGDEGRLRQRARAAGRRLRGGRAARRRRPRPRRADRPRVPRRRTGLRRLVPARAGGRARAASPPSAGVASPLIDSVAISNRTHQAAIATRLGELLGSGPDRRRRCAGHGSACSAWRSRRTPTTSASRPPWRSPRSSGPPGATVDRARTRAPREQAQAGGPGPRRRRRHPPRPPPARTRC